MATTNPNSPQILREQILADARQESDQILRRAQEAAEALLAKAAAEADKLRRERLEQARADAARRSELILATVLVEAGRLRSARVETLLESVRQEASRQLLAHEGFDYREAVTALAAHAIGGMTGEAFIVKLSPAAHKAFGEGLAEEIAGRTGRSRSALTITEDSTITGGGVIVQDAEGHQVWDNRFSARLERLWPELRRQIALQAELVGTKPRPGGAA